MTNWQITCERTYRDERDQCTWEPGDGFAADTCYTFVDMGGERMFEGTDVDGTDFLLPVSHFRRVWTGQ